MFFGKNKTSLKLVKPHTELLQGCEYHIIESANNPTEIKIGSGISKLYLRSPDGEEYLIEGNFNKIKDMFIPSKTYENMEGKLFKVTRPVASLMQNQMLKEIAPCQYDEKIQLGNGITEQYFIQKTTNKILKIYGNSNQIKNLFEEVVLPKPKPVVTQAPIQQTKVEIIEKVIVKETTPVVGAQGLQGEKGVKGDKGDRGEMGPKGPEGKQGEIGPRGEIGQVGPKGERGIEGPKGNKGDKGDKGDRGEIGEQGIQGIQGIQGPQGEHGLQGIPGINGKDGDQGPVGPQGEIGPQGIQGEKGEKGDRGPMGPQGPVGPRGEAGEIGAQGIPGKDGISPILNAEFPLELKDGNLSFNSTHITKILDKFKNSDIQKAIDKFSVVSSTPGGGGLGALWNGSRIQKNVSDINFTGSGVNVYQVGKGIRVDISGSSGGGGGGSAIAAGNTYQIQYNYNGGFSASPNLTLAPSTYTTDNVPYPENTLYFTADPNEDFVSPRGIIFQLNDGNPTNIGGSSVIRSSGRDNGLTAQDNNANAQSLILAAPIGTPDWANNSSVSNAFWDEDSNTYNTVTLINYDSVTSETTFYSFANINSFSNSVSISGSLNVNQNISCVHANVLDVTCANSYVSNSHTGSITPLNPTTLSILSGFDPDTLQSQPIFIGDVNLNNTSITIDDFNKTIGISGGISSNGGATFLGNINAPNITSFTEATTAPHINIPGDRWFNTNTGILYTAITGHSGLIWVQL
jgi:hypothetical protein